MSQVAQHIYSIIHVNPVNVQKYEATRIIIGKVYYRLSHNVDRDVSTAYC